MIHAWGNPAAMFQLLSSLVAVMACALLTYRLITSLEELGYLTSMLTAALNVGLVLGAALTLQLDVTDWWDATIGQAMFVFRVFTFGLAVTWPYWLRHSRSSRPVLPREPAHRW